MLRSIGVPALLSLTTLSAAVLGCGKLSPTHSVAPKVLASDRLASGVADARGRAAAPFPESLPLPVDFSPEGIAIGTGITFYAGSLRNGDIYRGNLRTGEGSIFVDAPSGRAAVGLKVDEPHHLLFVAGGATGDAYVYDTRSGASVKTVHFAQAGTTLLNDVVVTRDAAYFTDSFSPVLYKIAIGANGELGGGTTVRLSGPAATLVAGGINLNGIEATPNGKQLIVNHTALGALFVIDPATGGSRKIEVSGLVTGTLDGLLLQGRSLWVVENFANKLALVTLSPDLSRGDLTSEITSPSFRIPTTVARHGNELALINSRFDLGLPPPLGPGPPPGTEFNVVTVSRH